MSLDLTPAPHGTFALWWLGQSGFLINFEDAWLCFDPYLSDSLTRKYANTNKPHVRMKPIVADPATLRFVDVATSTHNHTDHLDAETLGAMQPKQLVIPEVNRDFVVNRLGCDPQWPLGLAPGETTSVGPFEFLAVPAKHEEKTPEYLGYVVRFGNFTVYHSGDTLLYQGMVQTLKPQGIDIALLPINGKVGNMSALEAAYLGKYIGAKLVIPCHYDMFEFNTADPQDFVREATSIRQPHRVLELGERLVWPLPE
ncbi:MBL fold metallo-hydrolase [Bryobacterales bacterium F-183]|nr:MBL fold metallo-hydrolase [Bryobacterales bacterium F-183]